MLQEFSVNVTRKIAKPLSVGGDRGEQRELFLPSRCNALWAADAFYEVLPGLGDSMFDLGGVG